MTFQRSDVERGLEPDECFWVASELLVREKEELDFTVDPPPDLAIEIDVSPSRLDRPAIYATLQVPELWIFDGEEVRVELLNRQGAYLPSATSVCFPFLPVHELASFIALGRKRSDTETLRLFIDWVREQKFQVNRPGEE